MKNILVTGGAGYIGSHTVVSLIKAGFRPVILDNFSNADHSVVDNLRSLTGQAIETYEQDYDDVKALEKILAKEHIDGVIHFAASKYVGESVAQPLKYYRNNVSGFVTLLESLQKRGIENFVFSSSAAVYGNPPTEQVAEDSPLQPESPYGWSKYMDEVILKGICNANKKFSGTALRYFNVVGADESAKIGELPKQSPQNLLPVIVNAAAGQTPPVTVFGDDFATPDGTCLRDYVHVTDLAEAHVAALKAQTDTGKGFAVFNVGTGKPTSVLELIKSFERVNKTTVPYKIGPRRAGDPVACYAAVKKIKQELGWTARKTIDDAVGDAWRWHQANTKPSS